MVCVHLEFRNALLRAQLLGGSQHVWWFLGGRYDHKYFKLHHPAVSIPDFPKFSCFFLTFLCSSMYLFFFIPMYCKIRIANSPKIYPFP